MNDEARSYWDRDAKHYDRSMLLLGGPMPRMVEWAAEAVRDFECVLEVAGGTGLVTTALARAAREVIATDYSSVMVDTLRQRIRHAGMANVWCEQADIYALPYAPASFDAVVAANVLHLLPDVPRALEAFRVVLKPGGLVIVPTYCHDETPVSRVVSGLLAVTGFPGRRRYRLSSLRAALEDRGILVRDGRLISGLIPIGCVSAQFPPRGTPP